MDVTVVVCTYNRCESLKTALESIATSTVPESFRWEVIVVDNNSTDQTRKVFEEISTMYPGRFRYVLESRQGLSNARNAGILESRGEIIAFTDDDIIVEKDWLWKLTSPLLNGKWSASGGRVVPVWESERPDWFPERLSRGVIVAYDLGSDAKEIQDPPFGANMAFPKGMFEKYGNFRSDLGRSGSAMLSNEDTDFGRRLLHGGERVWYEPSAVVYHPVPENRLTKPYFLDWWFGKGQADAREVGPRPKGKWLVAGVPVIQIRSLVLATIRWIFSAKPATRFYHKVCVWHYAGAIKEWFELGRTPSTKQRAVVSRSKPSA